MLAKHSLYQLSYVPKKKTRSGIEPLSRRFAVLLHGLCTIESKQNNLETRREWQRLASRESRETKGIGGARQTPMELKVLASLWASSVIMVESTTLAAPSATDEAPVRERGETALVSDPASVERLLVVELI